MEEELLGLHRLRLPRAEFLERVAADTAALAVDFKSQVIIHATKEAESLFQCDVDGGLDDKPFEILIPPEFREAHRKHIEEYGRNPKRRAMGQRRSKDDGDDKTLWAQTVDGGQRFPVAISLAPVQKDKRLYVILKIMERPD